MKNEFVMLSRRYPPRCLNGLSVQYTDEMDDEYLSEFKLSCNCENSKFELIGENDEELGMAPVISSKCTQCEDEKLIIDVNKFGYDAEYRHGTGYPEMEHGQERYRCKCGNTQLQVTLWFTYQFDSINDFQDLAIENISNYFDQVGIYAQCECGI